ncbi:MAG TPA: hypothetical protein VK968_12495 [Roseimicrobium sp.]|nr:hypothetical protein [Roseimicrobium sp.]
MLLLLAVMVTGCQSTRPCSTLRPQDSSSSKIAGMTAASPVQGSPNDAVTNHCYVLVQPRPDGPHPSFWQQWNPVWWFGNDDDPEPPEWYRPEDPRRRGKWYWRNPLHNFMFYVIGISDKEFTRSGRYPSAVFAPDGGWNFATSRRRWCILPFASYQRGEFKFYLGWRERGNFGGKLTF